MRFIGRREGVADGAASSGWTGPRRRPRATTRITLFVAFNYGGRAEIVDAARTLPGRLRGGVPPPPLRARDARPRPPDPNQRRAAASPTTCSGSAPTRSWSSATSSGRTSTATRSRPSLDEFEARQRRFGARGDDATAPTSASERRGREPASRRSRRRAVLVAIPAIVFAIAIIVAGGAGLRGRR